MKKYISIISMFFACFMGVANAVPMNAQIADLIQQKSEKIAKLEECEGKKKGWMIAGISTIGLTAVGVAGNIALAAKSKKLSAEIEAQQAKQGGADDPKAKLVNIIGLTEADYWESDEQTMTFSVDYGVKGIITGKAQCSTRSATNPWVGGSNDDYVLQSDGATMTLPDNSGKYCYCQLTSYTPSGGTTQSLSAPWVFEFEYSSDTSTSCAESCAEWCADDLYQDDSDPLAFREAMFNSVK